MAKDPFPKFFTYPPKPENVWSGAVLWYVLLLLPIAVLMLFLYRDISRDFLLGITILIAFLQAVLVFLVLWRRARAYAGEMLLLDLIENAPDPIDLLDSRGAVRFINGEAERITGYTKEEMVGKTFQELRIIAPESMPRAIAEFVALMKGERRPPFEMTIVCKDGSRRTLEVNTRILMYGGRPAGIECIFRDITKERELDRAKTEFVSIASHQLRTPLSIISWYTEMLLDPRSGKLSKKQSGYLLELTTANRRMLDLINALLNVSRLELGTFMVELKKTAVPPIAEEVLQELAPQIQKKELKVDRVYQEDMPELLTDRTLLRIIFQNLLSNAVKYTPEGGSITLHVQKEGPHLTIRVSDSGIGIPYEDQDQIFVKFFRSTNARMIDTEGTGLGLYIVKQILERVGGAITCESAPGKGTIFSVTVPAVMRVKKGTRTLV